MWAKVVNLIFKNGGRGNLLWLISGPRDRSLRYPKSLCFPPERWVPSMEWGVPDSVGQGWSLLAALPVGSAGQVVCWDTRKICWWPITYWGMEACRNQWVRLCHVCCNGGKDRPPPLGGHNLIEEGCRKCTACCEDKYLKVTILGQRS